MSKHAGLRVNICSFELIDILQISGNSRFLHSALVFNPSLRSLCVCVRVCAQMYDEVSGPGSRFKEKHSLDSDEEDEGEDGEKNSKYNILASDDIEGVFIYACLRGKY